MERLKKDISTLSKNNSHKIEHNWVINNINEKMNQLDKFFNFSLYIKKYKFKISYYPGGSGEGKGTHLSLYLGITQGENDDILLFPVDISYNFVLINQEKDAEHLNCGDYISSLSVINKTKAFNRELSDKNEGYGRPKWFSKENVLKYIKDNTLIVRLEIKFNKPWLH